jgi:hypothetical protein
VVRRRDVAPTELVLDRGGQAHDQGVATQRRASCDAQVKRGCSSRPAAGDEPGFGATRAGLNLTKGRTVRTEPMSGQRSRRRRVIDAGAVIGVALLTVVGAPAAAAAPTAPPPVTILSSQSGGQRILGHPAPVIQPGDHGQARRATPGRDAGSYRRSARRAFGVVAGQRADDQCGRAIRRLGLAAVLFAVRSRRGPDLQRAVPGRSQHLPRLPTPVD